MRELAIKKIELTNFKGEAHKVIEFNGKRTCISGKNGRGKSRIKDAFYWCIWGKDSQDRKDYEIQTRDERGEIKHNVDTVVTVVLCIVSEENSREVTFTRRLSENWVKPRGCTELVLKGRETKCEIDDVPMGIGEYNKRVADILLDADTFKLVTNPLYFSTIMEWRKRRELLFSIVQMASDEQIAEGDENLVALMQRMNGYDMVDYRKMIISRKNKTKQELDDIDPRIDQTEKMKPEAQNWGLLEIELADKEEKVKEAHRRMSDAKAVVEKAFKDSQALVERCGELKARQIELVAKENAKREAAAMEPMKALYEVREKRAKINEDLAITNDKVIELQKEIERCKGKSAEYEAKIADLRTKFEKEKAKSLADYVCPSCGQVLPREKAGETRTAYLTELKEKGAEYKAEKAVYDEKVSRSEMELTKAKTHFMALSSAKNELDGKMRDMNGAADVKKATVEDIPECMELAKQIAEIEAQAKYVKVNSFEEELKDLSALMYERDKVKELLNTKVTIENCDKEIENLKKRARELAQMIAEYQRDEDALDAFQRRKVEICEKSINDKFANVSFKLFNITLDGNLEECCEPMVKGALFGSANTAGQINAGIEIIKVVSEKYGVFAPVWIDNAESVNKVEETANQQVLLKVSEDEDLVVCNG